MGVLYKKKTFSDFYFTVSATGNTMDAAGDDSGRQCDRGPGTTAHEDTEKQNELLHHAACNSR